MNHLFDSLLSSVLLLCFLTPCFIRAENWRTTKDSPGARSDGFFLIADSSVGDAFLQICMQRYGSKAVDEVKNRLDEASVCLENIFYPLDGNLVSRILATGSTTNNMRDTPIATLCNNHLPDIEKCIQPFMSALKGCTDLEGHRDLMTISTTFSSVLNYACQDEGDRILKFVVKRGPECLKENNTYSKLSNCSKPLKNAVLSSLQRNVSIFNQDSCRVYRDQNDCLTQAFQDCTSVVVRDILQGLLDTVINNTKCFDRNSHQDGNGSKAIVCYNMFLLLCLVLVIMLSSQHL